MKFRAYHYTGTIYGYNNNTFITIHVMINQASSQGTHTHRGNHTIYQYYSSVSHTLYVQCVSSTGDLE